MRATLHGRPYEPAEPEPGPGWLRSRFMGRPYPRPGVVPCGRASCPVCDERAQSFVCEPTEADEVGEVA